MPINIGENEIAIFGRTEFAILKNQIAISFFDNFQKRTCFGFFGTCFKK